MAAPLRIAYVYRDFNDAGSIPSVFRDRAERLSHDEDVVAVCSAKTRDRTDAPLRFETVEPLARGRGRVGYAVECGSFAIRASRSLQRLRPEIDLVHVVGFDAPRADIVTVNAVRRAELDHYFDEFEPTARIRRKLAPVLRPQSLVVLEMERRLFREPFPYCIVESAAIARDLNRYYGVPEDAVEVLPAGIDVARLQLDTQARTAVRSRLNVPLDRLVVLFVGDEFGRKGLERAVRAIARMSSDAELWVAGRTDPQPFETLAASLEVQDRVRFFGRVDPSRMPEIYSGCDVLLLPSQQDAWGHPVIEAMAAKRVVLASQFAGAHVVIRDMENGFVLEGEGSPEQIAAILDGPAASPEIRASIGESASRTAAEFDRGVMYERLREAHHEAFRRRLSRKRRLDE